MEKVFDQRAAMDELVNQAVETIQNRLAVRATTAIILGSGLGSLVQELSGASAVPFADIPHFPVSSVPGHQGELIAGVFADRDLLVCAGRVHYYEGYDLQKVVFPVAVLAGLGIENLIITNASGGINESYAVGDIVAIRDHINMAGENPLRGSADFIDMTCAYSPRLRKAASAAASKAGLVLAEGVYAWMAGPCYETPAEIRMLRVLGADLVGMSTVPEVIKANSLGLQVLGLSMVSNMAAGISGNPLNHQEVVAAGKQTAEKFKRLIMGVLANMEQIHDAV